LKGHARLAMCVMQLKEGGNNARLVSGSRCVRPRVSPVFVTPPEWLTFNRIRLMPV